MTLSFLNIVACIREFLSVFQTLIMGNRDDIDDMSAGNASVLTTVLKLVDKYDLYGSVAFPKHHNQADVPEIYRLAAKMKVCCMPHFSFHFGNSHY